MSDSEDITNQNEYSTSKNGWKTWFNDNYETLELAGYVALGTSVFCAGGFFLYKYYYDDSSLAN